MARHPAEEVRPEHGGDHGAVAAARFPRDAAMRGDGERAVVRVDPPDHVLAEIGVIPADRRGVEELAASQRCPGVDEDNDGGRGSIVTAEERVAQLEEAGPEGAAIAPHRSEEHTSELPSL